MRSIRVGDFLTIGENQNIFYQITSMGNGNISILPTNRNTPITYPLIFDENRDLWTFPSTIIHFISREEYNELMSGPNGLANFPPEILSMILLDLPISKIAFFCIVNFQINEKVCSNDSFWKNKYIREYGEIQRPVTNWRTLFKNRYLFAEKTIPLLNKLSSAYKPLTGFDKEDNVDIYSDYNFYEELGALPKGPRMFYLTQEFLNNARLLVSKEIPFDLVIIKQDSSSFPREPQSAWFNKMEDSIEENHLPNLSSRPYIKVIESSEEVIISVVEKGSPITLDDIIFATRATIEYPEPIDRYYKYEINGNILKLMVLFNLEIYG